MNSGWQGGGNKGPWGNGPQRPPHRPANDIDDIIRRSQDRFKGYFGGGGNSGKGLVLIVAALAMLWLFSGFYRVGPDEQGVVLRFGEFNRVAPEGLHWSWPAPIETVQKPKVTRIFKEEIGFRTGYSPRDGRQAQSSVLEESLMLTGDENIVDINFEVQWKIKNARDFLFNVRNPTDAVKHGGESAMREVIGRTQIALALAEGKFAIEQDARVLLQQILDSYQTGIEIVRLQLLKVEPPGPVIDAFRDVQNAKTDQERARNEAEAYRNDIIPRARGQAEQVVQEAEAYKQQVVARAQGEASRFSAVLDEYRKAKDVTRKRMYLETMENILNGMNKIVIDQSAGKGVVPYLPLQDLQSRRNTTGGSQ